jgi:hypothetical protein
MAAARKSCRDDAAGMNLRMPAVGETGYPPQSVRLTPSKAGLAVQNGLKEW